MTRPTLVVGVSAPSPLSNRAAWVIGTLLGACGARVEVLVEPGPDALASCALAYAPEPVPGVPTVPLSTQALDLLAARRPLPAGSFGDVAVGGVTIAGAFRVSAESHAPASEKAGGFAVPFDLVASSFVLLAAWDELTSSERDVHGRFPYASSFFAREPALDVGRPAVDGYLAALRAVVDARLGELGRAPLDPPGWGAGARFAIALTHDVDSLKRWTTRRWLAAGKRTAEAVRRGNLEQVRFELGGMANAVTHDVSRGRDPYWTFPDLLRREDELGVSSTFFLLPSHGHPTDGGQGEIYQNRVPELVRLLGRHDREIGLHGNHRDGRDAAALDDDRASLAGRARVTIDGMRYHYLKCLYHETLPMLDQAGFIYDTSLAYAEREGWRSGFSHPFHPYDVARERPLELVELPLALMDATLQEKKYRGLAAPQAREASLTVAARLAETGGGSAVLWHHNRFHPYVGRGYGQVYWDLVDWAEDNGGALLSAGELVRRWKQRTGDTEP